MARHLSVGSVIEKNKITSNVAWVVLLELHVTDPNTREVTEVVRVARNNENITFGVDENGDPRLFNAANFTINIEQNQNQTPNVTLTCKDPLGYVQSRLEAAAGGLFSEVVMIVVNTARLDKPAEIEHRFQVLTSSCKDYVITAQLGSENPLNIQFPKHRQWQSRCAWRFKGYGCAYSGPLATCDYTKDGPNGCDKHFTGILPFRGLPGLVVMNI